MNPTTFERLQNLLVEQLGVEPSQVTLETRLEDLGADSLDQVELIMAVEDEWLFEEIADEEAEKIKTVGEAVAAIDAREAAAWQAAEAKKGEAK